jgi:D-3-phosphoglycerate dehydrogenase
MEPYRVALSSDFTKEDGTPTFPSFDLSPLTDNPKVEKIWVDAVDGVIPASALDECDALILLMPKVTRQSIPQNGRLKAVARFGVGYDTVDVDACTDGGVAVVITPDGVRRPVAVSIITYILALSQKLLIKDRICRQGPDGWAKRADHMGTGLVGKTFGQLGIGNIGAEAFRMAAPFGMRLIAHDPWCRRRPGRSPAGADCPLARRRRS